MHNTTTGYDAKAYGHRLRSLGELRSGECPGFCNYTNVLVVNASFAARAFNHFMDCVYMSQKTKKENPTAAQKDSKPQNATMQPSNDERRADTSIAMHREGSDVDRSQEIGLHNTFEDYVSGHTVLKLAGPTDNNEGREEVAKNM